MKIFKSDVIKGIDAATCKAQNIDSITLMERAANAISCEIISKFLPDTRIVVFAGPGNNGGDALATARMLYEQGYKRIEVFLFNVKGKLSDDCERERDMLLEISGIDFTEITREFHPPYLSENDLVVDGLFGSGLHQPMQGGFTAVAKLINESGAYVVSIDIPSGLFGEWNSHTRHSDIVHADLTLAFQFPRLSFLFAENENIIGEWKVIDIELDRSTIKTTPTDYILVEGRNIKPLLRPRRKFSGKRDYGSVLMMCGSMGMTGAAVMASTGALRSGAGLVTVHSAGRGLDVLQTAVPEAICEPDRNEYFITDMSSHHHHQVIAVGPGIGTNERTIDALEELLKTTKTPLVLDADALNCIVKRPALLSMIPPNTIITPHAGEFDRLFGEHTTSEDRLKKALEISRYYNIFIVLKGHYTATIRPTGRVYFNSSGNPGMATAGSGDVLTGIISSFIAQGYRPEHAATIGVYIHGVAGDMAAEELGEAGMTAMDIAKYVGRAIRKVSEGKNKSFTTS